MDERTPILVGAGQRAWHETPPSHQAMMVAAEQAALADAGLDPTMSAAIDDRIVIAAPQPEIRAIAGGTAPLRAVEQAMTAIAAGQARLVLVGGAHRADDTPPDPCAVLTAQEAASGLGHPGAAYALFENALRARRGRSLKAQLRRIGDLMAPFSGIAADNRFARHRDRLTPADLAPGPANPLVAYPYARRVIADGAVNQAAALLVTSAGAARRLGIPEDRWIYRHGHGAACDTRPLTRRPEFHASPAMRAAGLAALAMAGWTIADIDLVDLPAAAPAAIQIVKDALALPEVDGPALTVTGGGAFFGQPGDLYACHALGTMMARLRAAPGRRGLVAAEGLYLADLAVSLFSTARPDAPFALSSPSGPSENAPPPAPVAASADGRARIDSYTVLFDSSGQPVRGIVVGRLVDGGQRFVANTPDDVDLLDSLLDGEAIGRRGQVQQGANGALFVPD